jgi:hypothetical protein
MQIYLQNPRIACSTDLVSNIWYCRVSPCKQFMRRPSRAINLLRGIPSCTHCAYTSSLGRYVFGSEISYNKAPPRLPGLGC